MTPPDSKGQKPKKHRREGPGPALQSFTLNPDTARSGALDPLILEIGLDGPAPPGGVNVQVDVFEIAPHVPPDQRFGPAIGVLVGEGETTGSTRVPVMGLPPGVVADFRFEARLGDVTRTAMFRVVG